MACAHSPVTVAPPPCPAQLASELEDKRSELQHLKRQQQRSEQMVASLEEEIRRLKSKQRRRSSAADMAEDSKKELERWVRVLSA